MKYVLTIIGNRPISLDSLLFDLYNTLKTKENYGECQNFALNYIKYLVLKTILTVS